MSIGERKPSANLLRPKAASGINGLDEVLAGGFVSERMYLVQGEPGSGKTTLALQFLLEGCRNNESVLYVTLSESESELLEIADSHGWDLTGMQIRELGGEVAFQLDEQYTMFHPSEVELGETTKAILADVDRIRPTRIVLDSLSELRLLASNALQYRRQIMAIKHFFMGRNCTILLLDDMTGPRDDLQVQSMAHGVLRLQQMWHDFGSERRRLVVSKFRGVSFRGGYHDYVIRRGGLIVYPRLIANESRTSFEMERLPSGVVELDQLLGGGIEKGTSTLIMGAAGTGKSTLATAFARHAALRNKTSSIFTFDESIRTLTTRSTNLNLDLQPHLESGLISIQQIDPAELSPGEFIHNIRTDVETRNLSVLIIDSLNGYLNAMPNEHCLIIQLHELLTYLGQRGVATILVGAHQGLIGSQMVSPVDASYLADTVILTRYFELRGEVRQAISVVKKRGGAHERTIREMRLTNAGISVGQPLYDFRGILTGVPIYEGSTNGLSERTTS